MASYHFMWDLALFGYLDSDFPSTGWPKLYARTIASTFLFMAGFSLVLAHPDNIRWRNFAKRFAAVVGGAILVSCVMYVIAYKLEYFIGRKLEIPEAFIYFGILHEIALASLIGLLFLRIPWLITVAVAIAVIAAPNYLRFDAFNTPWLWWVGLSTRPRGSFDYVPLLPWLGPFLLGVATARLGIIQNWLRQNARGITSSKPRTATLAFLGRHGLVFYLVHQLVLGLILYVFSLVMPAPQVAPEVKYIRSCEMTCKPDRSADFCHRFCGCTLTRLQQLKLLTPFQSGAISVDDDERIRDIAVECTTLSQ